VALNKFRLGCNKSYHSIIIQSSLDDLNLDISKMLITLIYFLTPKVFLSCVRDTYMAICLYVYITRKIHKLKLFLFPLKFDCLSYRDSTVYYLYHADARVDPEYVYGEGTCHHGSASALLYPCRIILVSTRQALQTYFRRVEKKKKCQKTKPANDYCSTVVIIIIIIIIII